MHQMRIRTLLDQRRCRTMVNCRKVVVVVVVVVDGLHWDYMGLVADREHLEADTVDSET